MRARTVVLALFLFATSSDLVEAQTLGGSGGRQPFGSYFDADIDSINIYNGNLMLDIDVFTLPGRELSSGLRVTYNSQKWQWADLLGWPVGLYSGGWRVADLIGEKPLYAVEYAGCQPDGYGYYYDYYDVIANWIDGLGTKHVYATQLTELTQECGFSTAPSGNNQMLASSQGDGSWLYTGNTPSEAVLTFKDGTQISFGSSETVSTRNGNYLTRGANGLPVQDTLARTIGFETNKDDPSPEYYKSYTILDSNGLPQTYTLNYLDGYSVWNPMYGQWETRNDRLYEIVLQDGRKYSFEYQHVQGYLTKVTLPSGGFIVYEYPAEDPYSVVNDYVTARHVSYDGVNIQSSWTYTRSSNSATRDITVTTTPEGYVAVHRFGGSGFEYETQWYDSGGLKKRARITRNTNGSPWTIKTSLNDVAEQTTTLQYDSNGSLSLRDESDWHAYEFTGTPPPLRRTQIWYNYYSDPFWFQRPRAEAVYSWNASTGQYEQQSYIEYEYDGFSLQGTPPDVPNKGTVTGVRGNMTLLRRHDGLGGALVEQFHYDDLGNVVISTDPIGHDTSISYADNFSDPQNNRNTFAYPTAVSEDVNGVPQIERTVYDYNTGIAKRTTDIRQQDTLYTYDRYGRPTEIQAPRPDGPLFTRYEYDNATLKVTLTVTAQEGSDHKSEIYFDRFYRQIREVDMDPGGAVFTDIEYYSDGRLKRVSAPYRQGEPIAWTETTYDVLGRPVEQRNPDGTTRVQGYSGIWSSTTDEANVLRWFRTNGIGQLVQVQESVDPPIFTDYTYYATGPLRSVSQTGQTRSFTYDWTGLLRSETHPESGMTSYQYDRGRLVGRTDARAITATYGYDPIGRLQSLSYSDGTPPVSYTYDQNGDIGLLTSEADGTGTTTFDYDTAGRLVTETRQFYGVNTPLSASYTYYRDDRLQSVTYPTGRTVTYTYQTGGGLANDQLASITDNMTPVPLMNSFQYNAAGQPSGWRLGNGVEASHSYNSRSQLTGIAALRNGTPLMSLSYGYGDTINNGRIRSRTDALNPDHSVNYSYDWGHRLESVSAMNGSWGISWEFDVWGNRRKQIPTGTATSKVGSPQSVYVNNRNADFGYDAAGNVTYDSVKYYNYDAENRLWRVDNGAVRYQYDAEGRRAKKITGSETTYYVYGQVGLLSEFTIGTGTMQASVNDRQVYRLAEQTGTSVLLLAADGTLIEENRVLPYGEPWNSTTADNEQKFTTYQRDGESGLDYAMARYYASRSGRFMTPDPGHVGADPANPQSWNAYAYAGNDPINLIDPTGTEECRDQELLEAQGLTCDYWRPLLELFLFASENSNPVKSILLGVMDTIQTITKPNEEKPRPYDCTAGGQFLCDCNGNRIGASGNAPSASVPLVEDPVFFVAGFAASRIVSAGAVAAGSTAATVGDNQMCEVLLRSPRQLQAKFKHAADFGVGGGYNRANAAEFSRAINQHINRPGVRMIQGTYRGQTVIHYVDPSTGLNVIADRVGNFISGWRLSPAQLQNVLTHGGLR